MLNCAWCSKIISEENPAHVDEIYNSHSICVNCISSMDLFDEEVLIEVNQSILTQIPFGTAELDENYKIISFSTDNADTIAYLSEIPIISENYLFLLKKVISSRIIQKIQNQLDSLFGNATTFWEYYVILGFKNGSKYILYLEGYYYQTIKKYVIELKLLNELSEF